MMGNLKINNTCINYNFIKNLLKHTTACKRDLNFKFTTVILSEFIPNVKIEHYALC